MESRRMALFAGIRARLPGPGIPGRAGKTVRWVKPQLERLEEREVLSSPSGSGAETSFITGLFHEILHRAPTNRELAAWVGKLDDGLSEAQVTAILSQSAGSPGLTNPPPGVPEVHAPPLSGSGSGAVPLGNGPRSGGTASPASNVADPPLAAAANAWTALGPAPIDNGQVPGGNPVSGRVSGLATDPTNPNIIYMAAAGGGVWKTTNGGTTWVPLTDQQETLFMGAIAVAPSNPQVIYAGTGESTNSGLSFYGRGILKSNDGGATWTLETAGGAFDRREFSKIVVDPTNANIAYAAVTDFGVNGLSGNTGVWKTTDGGATWTNTTTAIPVVTTTDEFSDVVIDPANPLELFCAVGSASGAAGNGVYETINGGATWAAAGNFAIGSANGNIKLGLAPSNPNTIYASVVDPATQGISYVTKTTDGGVTWNHVTTPPNYLAAQGDYDSYVAVDPANPSIVYLGGSQNGVDGSGNFIEQVLRSGDGGTTWNDITVGATGDNGPHADHHAVTFDASGRLLDGNDGGVWRLDNGNSGSVHWTDLNGNLGTIQFIGVALHPSNAGIAYGGSQDNGTSKFTGSPAWQLVQGGDGGFVRVDFNNPNTVYHTFFRVQGSTSFIERSDNAGGSWTDISAGINPNDNSEFYVPYVMDPSNSSRLILGTDHVYVTTDRGATWTVIGTPGSNGFNTGGATVTALAVASTNGQVIYAAAGGNIFVTTDSGATWQQRSIPATTAHIQDLEVDPTNSNLVYAVHDEFDVGKVFRSSDGGATWTDISGNLPNLPAYSLAIDTPDSALFLGNDNGAYVSTDAGASWSTMGTGLPHAQSRNLQFNATLHVLASGTHGRSMWEISTLGPGQTPIIPVGTNVTADFRIFGPMRYTFNAQAGTLDGNLTLLNTTSTTLAFPSGIVAALQLPAGYTLANPTGQLVFNSDGTATVQPNGNSTGIPAIFVPLTRIPPGTTVRVHIRVRPAPAIVPSTFFEVFPVQVFAA
jgi:photosystem II stability/assembly factor-like uncharacterized protein